jgi:carbon-monoxide dehydrogenase small subunit
MTIEFTLNGRRVSAQADPAERLSDFLHDRLGTLSVRRGCGSGRCGSCLVLMDGKAVPSCLIPSFRARGSSIISYEGLLELPDFQDVLAGFAQAGVRACEFCLPGKSVLAVYLLGSLQDADRAGILSALAGVACRCTDAETLARGVEAAMDFRRERLYGPPV